MCDDTALSEMDKGRRCVEMLTLSVTPKLGNFLCVAAPS
jgi:hypothetical protein